MKRFIAWTAAALMAVGALAEARADDAQLKVGAAMRDVTPEELLPISGGIGIPTQPDELRGRLSVRAMVFEKGETRLAIVGADFLGWSAALADRSREKIPGIPPGNVLISATHNHSGPDPYGFPDLRDGGHHADVDYLMWVTEQIAEAVNEALENARPAALRIAVGDVEGKIAYNYYAPDPPLMDKQASVLQAVALDGENKGEAIATMLNFAIHPEVLSQGQRILSPDLCGPLYDRIEAKGGGMALFVNGALGGMITADNRGPDGRSIRTWDECVRIGEALADETMRIIEGAPLQEDPVLHVDTQHITFPVDSQMIRYILENAPIEGAKLNRDNSIWTQLNLVNIGSAQMVTIPGEALPNIGFYLKRNMPTKHPFLLGLTNDAFGYIMVKVDFDSFPRYDYISRTSLGEMTGEIFIERTMELIKRNPKPDEAPRARR